MAFDFGPYGPVADRRVQFEGLLSERATLPGAIAEFGVYNGGSTRHLAGFGRTVFAFDTFEGMPSQEFNGALDHDEPGKFKPQLPLNQMFEGYHNVIPMVGRFVETLPKVPAHTKFVFVYMDCDLYESYRLVLDRLAKGRLVQGAAIVCDDYPHCKGAVKAIDEFVAANPSATWNATNQLLLIST